MSLHSWFKSLKQSSRRRNRKSSGHLSRLKKQRRMFVEPLEDRRLLAGMDLINIDIQGGGTVYNGQGVLGSPSDTTWNAVGTSGTDLLFSDGSGSSAVDISITNYVGSFANAQQANPILRDWVYGFGNVMTITISDLDANSLYDVALYNGFYWQDYTVPGQPGLLASTRPDPFIGSAGAPPFPSGTYGVLEGVVSDASGTITIIDTPVSGGRYGLSSEISGLQIQRRGGAVNAPPESPTDGDTAANLVAEGAANGTAVGITASSTDPDGDTVTYSFTNNAGGRFAINPTTGVVTVLNGALLDGPASHTITVQSSDGNGGTASSNFSISVGNVAPSIALSGAPAVNEGSPYTLHLGVVTDPGQDTITAYKIAWGDGNIESFTGSPENTTATHTFADGPDNQVNNVTVTDEDGSFLAGSLSVQVLNVAPTIALTGDATVDEGSSYTLNLGAITDPGDDTVTAYSINWGDDNIENFTGNPANSTRSHTYADGTNFYPISVSLTDEDGTHLDTGMIWVMVDNVAPTTPIDNDAAANEVTENAAAGTLVGITAASTDVGVLDTVTYSLTDDAGGRFTIDANTGVVSVANGAVLDYEAATSHNITVQASDGEDATTQTFTIDLINVTATISGTVFVDVNGNGLFDGGSETGIDGVIIELLDSAGGLLDTDVTELGGVYAFVVDDEFAMYRIREIQPTGVSDGAAILGSAAVDSVLSSNEMQLTLDGIDAADYDFTEIGQAVQSGDSATIGFWQNKNGQALIQQGGAALVTWLNTNFGNIFGNTFSDGNGGDDAAEVANFYKNEFFKKKLTGTPKVDAQFMATALATFFTSSNLSGGSVAASYGFNVTQTGIGTKVVNVGSNGAAFDVSNNTEMTIMSLLLATNRLTGADSDADASEDYSHVYDTNGDGVLDDTEKALRVMANNIYSAINEDGDI